MTDQERQRLAKYVDRDPSVDLSPGELIDAMQLLAQSMKEQGIGVKRASVISPDGVWSENYG